MATKNEKADLKEAMKAELMAELREELKAEMAAEMAKNKKSTDASSVDLDREVPIRSVCYGTLEVAMLDGTSYPFSKEGDRQYPTIRQLRALKAAKPDYFTAPLFIIEDEEAVRVCGLTDFYKKISFIDNLPKFFNERTEEQVLQALRNVPHFLLLEIFNKLQDLWDKNIFQDVKVASLLKREYDVDLFDSRCKKKED